MVRHPELDYFFSWYSFYEEFASRLLEHERDRSKLIEAIHNIDTSSRGSIVRLIGNRSWELVDICPFTTMWLFSRTLSDNRYFDIASAMARCIGIEIPASPMSERIHVLENLKLRFFFPGNSRFRRWDHIQYLWDVFSAAIHFADYNDSPHYFIQAYNEAIKIRGVGWNLTVGLHWARPRCFQSLYPETLRTYIRDDLKISMNSKVLSAGAYLVFLDDIQKKCQDPNYLFDSFPELTFVGGLNAYQRKLIFSQISTYSDDYDDNYYAEEDTVINSRFEQESSHPETYPYTVKHILEDGCFLEESQLTEILERLEEKQNLILQGPPGTGKTWLAKRLAYALIGRQDTDKVRSVQFHPNMSYEDFVRGWRPSGDGNLELVDGPFIEMIDAAREDQNSRHVIVIEEINRGNPAQIFGEMLTLLEADKRTPDEALELTYRKRDGERVHIPENLYVIGTMNMADRSLAMVDFALRRRFAFINMEPALNERWSGWVHEQSGIDRETLSQIKSKLDSLNHTIADDPNLGPHFAIGHSFVTPNDKIDSAGDWFRQVVETEIGPLLDEYWYDDRDKAQEERNRLLSGI